MRRKMLYRRLVHEFNHRIYSPGSNHEVSFREWLEKYKGDKELILEIGTGTGDFLAYQAKTHPELFYLGVEAKADRVYKACARAEEEKLDNIAFLHTDASRLLEFDLPQVSALYLLFSDPWPKKRHIIRRLTSEMYLPLYAQFMAPKGELIQKTDNRELYEYTILSLKEHKWKVIEKDNRYKTPNEAQTQYERKFLAMNKPVFYLKARVPLRKSNNVK